MRQKDLLLMMLQKRISSSSYMHYIVVRFVKMRALLTDDITDYHGLAKSCCRSVQAIQARARLELVAIITCSQGSDRRRKVQQERFYAVTFFPKCQASRVKFIPCIHGRK